MVVASAENHLIRETVYIALVHSRLEDIHHSPNGFEYGLAEWLVLITFQGTKCADDSSSLRSTVVANLENFVPLKNSVFGPVD